jgi:DNA-directed RNA polymerase subunit RPC12/RpoP
MKLTKLFIYSVGSVLLAAGLIRFLIAVGNAQVLALPDPVLEFPLRYAVLLVGSAEMIVALLCLFGRRPALSLAAIAWLATCLLSYQMALVWMHCHSQATCIGALNDPFHISGPLTGYIIGFLPLFLAVASYGTLTVLRIGKNPGKTLPIAEIPQSTTPKSAAPSQPALVRFLKIPCTRCGGHIEFPTNAFGETIPCPHCHATITLQKPKNVKMSCPACAGRIEFPDYAIGQQITCPHCKTDIMLKEPK